MILTKEQKEEYLDKIKLAPGLAWFDKLANVLNQYEEKDKIEVLKDLFGPDLENLKKEFASNPHNTQRFETFWNLLCLFDDVKNRLVLVQILGYTFLQYITTTRQAYLEGNDTDNKNNAEQNRECVVDRLYACNWCDKPTSKEQHKNRHREEILRTMNPSAKWSMFSENNQSWNGSLEAFEEEHYSDKNQNFIKR